MYKIVDGKIVRERSCPRCGPGIFLSQGQGRLYCGKCHFTEFLKKADKPAESEEKKEEPKKE